VLLGPVIFPDLDDWLSSLDSHPICGWKNLNYVQYAMGLMAQGILDLNDLLSLTADKVLELSGPELWHSQPSHDVCTGGPQQTLEPGKKIHSN
jgi:hypothetical protein